VVRLVVTGESLTWRPKKSLRCLLAKATWQIRNKRANCLHFHLPSARAGKWHASRLCTNI